MDIASTERLTLFKRFASIHRAFAASLDFETALGLIAGSGLELVSAASCLVLLREEKDALRVCAAQGVDPTSAGRFIGSMRESILDELRQDLGFVRSQSVAAAPIMSDRGVRGILVVIRDAPLNADETWLLCALADQAGITLENAHLHERLISRAAKLQEEVDRSRNEAREIETALRSILRDPRGPRLEAQLRDLLDYGRLTRTRLDLEPVDLEGAVLEALAGIETEMKGRGGVARVEAPSLSALAHRETLVDILGRLFSNALKFVHIDEKPLVEVRARRNGMVVRVSVRDDGKGIGEAFRNAEDVETPSHLGLAVVRKGLERMGGRCGVESDRFWIELRGA